MGQWCWIPENQRTPKLRITLGPDGRFKKRRGCGVGEDVGCASLVRCGSADSVVAHAPIAITIASERVTTSTNNGRNCTNLDHHTERL